MNSVYLDEGLMSVGLQENEEEKINPTLLYYRDARQHCETFASLLRLEADYSRLTRSVSLRWEMALSGTIFAHFCLPGANAGGELRIVHGDELHLVKSIGEADEEIAEGHVMQIPDDNSDEVVLEMNWVPEGFTNASTYDVKFNPKRTWYGRTMEALTQTQDICMKLWGLDLLGTEDVVLNANLPKDLNAPGLPELNYSQKCAVRSALKRHLSLIQGPPGTGKTVTSAAIVYHLHQVHRARVLVVAPSNTAVEHLCDKIHGTGLNVVRVCARSREAEVSPGDAHALHIRVAKAARENVEFRQLQQLKEECGIELSYEDKRRYHTLKRNLENEVLLGADVICCTCVTAGWKRLRMDFHSVLIDESTQATEPECLIPLMGRCRQVVLVGDQCQLGPVVTCQKAANAGLTLSLFERLILLGLQPFSLQVQYRMHPALAAFPNSVFYEGSLQNGVTIEERTKSTKEMGFPWPNPHHPMFFYCTSMGQEEIAANAMTYLNRTEAGIVEEIAAKMLKENVEPSTIGVITPYEGQRAYIKHYFQQSGSLPSSMYEGIEVASVDAFQGREKDYIIISCVRGNVHHGIGFLNDPRRLNVALTRAKFGLIVIGNPETLSKQPVWNQLLHFFKDQHLLVEGPLSNLREYKLSSSKPVVPYTYKAGSGLISNQLAKTVQSDLLSRAIAQKQFQLYKSSIPVPPEMLASGAFYSPPTPPPTNALTHPLCCHHALRHCAMVGFRIPANPPSLALLNIINDSINRCGTTSNRLGQMSHSSGGDGLEFTTGAISDSSSSDVVGNLLGYPYYHYHCS